MQAKLVITFERLNEPNFFAKAQTINTALATNPSFPAPWPSPALSSPANLTALWSTFMSAYNLAGTHDTGKINTRNTARLALTTYLKKLAPYLETVANGDLTKLISTGYDLRHDTAHTGGTDPLPAPVDFALKRGALSGVLLAHARKLKGAKSYRLQITEGDPTVEANWQDYNIFTSCNKIEISGQTPGKTVSARLCGIDRNGPGVWAGPLSCMVV